MNIDQWVNEHFSKPVKAFSDFVFYGIKVGDAEVTLVVLWLVIAAVYFTIKFRFINITGFWEGIKIIRGSFSGGHAPGEVNHFEAFCTAVSGTVGIGNIGAVAFAVLIGGPGAVFWLIVAGLLGMTTKFVECTLGVKYRRENPDGSISGGPMYFLEKGFGEKGFKKLGKGLAVFYAIGMCISCLGIGNMFQSNQAFEQFVGVTGGAQSFFSGKGWLFGTALAVIVGMVTLGGIRSIARVTSRLVPFMAVLYVLGALVIITMNFQHIPASIGLIFKGAFSPEGISGGMIGVMFLGFKRALFSNEAGLGSATIAHSAVKTNYPVTEGLVALLEPFLDTVVVCTLTSLVIITSMVAVPGFQDGVTEGSNLAVGIQLTSAAFERNIAWSPPVLTLVAILFAVSTMISWSYYGLKAWTYLVGEGKKRILFFNLLFCLFIVLGCMMNLMVVIDFSDAILYLICIPNIVGLYVLAPVVKEELVRFRMR